MLYFCRGVVAIVYCLSLLSGTADAGSVDECYMMVIDLLAVASHYQMPLSYEALRLQSMA